MYICIYIYVCVYIHICIWFKVPKIRVERYLQELWFENWSGLRSHCQSRCTDSPIYGQWAQLLPMAWHLLAKGSVVLIVAIEIQRVTITRIVVILVVVLSTNNSNKSKNGNIVKMVIF